MKLIGIILLLFSFSIFVQADGLFPAKYFGKSDFPEMQKLHDQEKIITTLNRKTNFEEVISFSNESRYRKIANKIGRLDVLTPKGVATCTAWLIADDILITNHHCIPGSSGEINDALFLANYLKQGEEGEKFKVDTQPLESNDNLDYSIIRVHGNPGKKFGVVNLNVRRAKKGEELFVIHHPAGLPMKLTRRNCRKTADNKSTEQPEFLHFCDTLGGSSGSPVFSDNDNAIVGLHHAGTPGANFAVPMEKIVAISPILQKLQGDGGSHSTDTKTANDHHSDNPFALSSSDWDDDSTPTINGMESNSQQESNNAPVKTQSQDDWDDW